jgi:hypothetical protein
MHMGYYAAVNIHQLMLHRRNKSAPKFIELQEIPPMIALAIGKKAVCYTPTEGTTSSEELMSTMFGQDLAHTSNIIQFRLFDTHLTLFRSMLELHAIVSSLRVIDGSSCGLEQVCG